MYYPKWTFLYVHVAVSIYKEVAYNVQYNIALGFVFSPYAFRWNRLDSIILVHETFLFCSFVSGSLLVAGGHSPVLHVWDMIRHTVKQVIQLPGRMKNIQSLFFVPGSAETRLEGGSVLGVLSQDGIVRFIHLIDCKPIFQLGSRDMVIYVYLHVLALSD